MKKPNTLLVGFLKDKLKIQNSSLSFLLAERKLCWLADLSILDRLIYRLGFVVGFFSGEHYQYMYSFSAEFEPYLLSVFSKTLAFNCNSGLMLPGGLK